MGLRPAWNAKQEKVVNEKELAVEMCNFIKVAQEVHNIRTIDDKEMESLDYKPGEEKVFAKVLCHAQLLIMQKGIKEFGERGTSAAKAEMQQMLEAKSSTLTSGSAIQCLLSPNELGSPK